MNQVPQIILEQLGGNKFIAMVGARNFVGSERCLQFDLPRGAANGASRCQIALAPSDLYVVAFYKWKPRDLAMIKVGQDFNGVYAEQLVPIFEKASGFRCSL